MLRALRRRLHEVDYHAAPLPSDSWSRWMRRAVFAALPIGVGAVLLGELAHGRWTVVATLDAGFVQPAPGTLRAVVKKDELGRLVWPADLPWGEARMVLEVEGRGWPFPTRFDAPRGRLELRRFVEATPDVDAAPAPDDPIWTALDRAVELPRDRAILAAVAARHAPELRVAGADAASLDIPRAGRRWGKTTWIGGLVAFAFALVTTRLLRLARYLDRLRREHAALRRRRREASNRCTHCGYDLRGLEWNERCPECGQRT